MLPWSKVSVARRSNGQHAIATVFAYWCSVFGLQTGARPRSWCAAAVAMRNLGNSSKESKELQQQTRQWMNRGLAGFLLHLSPLSLCHSQSASHSQSDALPCCFPGPLLALPLSPLPYPSRSAFLLIFPVSPSIYLFIVITLVTSGRSRYRLSSQFLIEHQKAFAALASGLNYCCILVVSSIGYRGQDVNCGVQPCSMPVIIPFLDFRKTSAISIRPTKCKR